MNPSPAVQLAAQQLLHASPILLVAIVGGVLGMLTLRKSVSAGSLMVGGALLIVFGRLIYLVAYVAMRTADGMDPAARVGQMQMLGLVSTVLAAVALAMVFGAGFVGRGEQLPSD